MHIIALNHIKRIIEQTKVLRNILSYLKHSLTKRNHKVRQLDILSQPPYMSDLTVFSKRPKRNTRIIHSINMVPIKKILVRFDFSISNITQHIILQADGTLYYTFIFVEFEYNISRNEGLSESINICKKCPLHVQFCYCRQKYIYLTP